MTTATPSITTICDELLRKGERPSAAKVREIRGSGSNSTIQPGIDEWWNTLIDRMNYFSNFPTLDQSVVAAAAKMQKAANQIARNEYQESEAGYLERIALLEEENGRLHDSNTELAQQIESQVSVIDLANSEVLTLRDERAEIKNKVKIHEASIRAQKDLLDEIRAQNIEKSKLLDISKEEVRELSNTNHALEGQITAFEKEIAEIQSRHNIESKEFSFVISQRNDTQVVLEERVSTLKSKLDEELIEFNMTVAENVKLKDEVGRLTSYCTELRNKMAAHLASSESHMQRMEALDLQLLELKDDKTFLKEELNNERLKLQELQNVSDHKSSM